MKSCKIPQQTTPFSKYSGCGNDFILIDNRSLSLPHPSPLARSLCKRKEGIGADGLILLENSTSANFKMRIFNSDGSEAEMCGNGIRCFFKYLQKLNLCDSETTVEVDGRILPLNSNGELVSVEMGEITDIRWNLPYPPYTLHHLNSGVPHAVLFVEGFEEIDLVEVGKKIRLDPLFSPKGCNVNFVKLLKENKIFVRTYERGVEGETLACGTGATAAALAAAQIHQFTDPIKVQLLSGEELTIRFQKERSTFHSVTMEGPVSFTFDGTLTL